jgi:hypothetical protein
MTYFMFNILNRKTKEEIAKNNTKERRSRK